MSGISELFIDVINGIDSNLLVDLVKVIKWPVTLFLIFLIIVRKYPKAVRNLILRIKSIENDKIKILFNTETSPKSDTRDHAGGDDWELYWLGHDLAWTISHINLGKPKEDIIHGLSYSLMHLKPTKKFPDIEKNLDTIIHNVLKKTDEQWNSNTKTVLAHDIADLIDEIGNKLEKDNTG